MVPWFQIAIAVIVAYLIGSIPTSVWLGRGFFKVDVRNEGSGNAGATNTMRTLGLKAGLFVLAFDIFKGWFAVYISNYIDTSGMNNIQYMWLEVSLASAAVLGHVLPVYVGFKGGKGMATLVGVMLGLHPLLLASVAGIFVLVFLVTGIVSIASMAGAMATPFFAWFLFGIHDPVFLLFTSVIAIFVPFMHRKNIQRLLKGEEKRFTLKKKK